MSMQAYASRTGWIMLAAIVMASPELTVTLVVK